MAYLLSIIHILFAIFFAIHAVRNNRELYWVMILILFPMLGSIVYFFAVYLPSSRMPHQVRKATNAAMSALDPGRELREAKQAFDLTPSAQNQMRLAAAYLEAGDAQQAAQLYEGCLQGPFANEKEMLYGAARARLQNGQSAAALELLQKIRGADAQFRKEAMYLLFGRAYAAEGQNAEARVEFVEAVTQFGSVEAYVEYALWALSVGEVATAEAQRDEINKLKQHWNKHHLAFHKELLQRLDQAFARVGKKA
ncbi:hypothetical protein RF679_01870 [Undibacterium cyanobacteriorum]|uniref:Cardiolipin synthase N-terminal domain-containing protein n=1 Tax=Undibacterium cyanobacteriorum TaxID=3073561 RepID=A0ABY9RM24_9BURK|nr:hypothetical protein [Undibacterium sp. 20NA77.5]WMW81041.1 hypothetical protein RF679_01870 [Undibacterium sp. 20NA77.5]